MDNCINNCKENTNRVFNKYSKSINDLSADHKVCLIKCTDKLNFPSEELTCYDLCEESYSYKLVQFKENLYKDLDKIIK